MQLIPFSALQKNTILMPTPDSEKKHLYIVLTPKHGNPPKVVIVNISTRQRWSDSTTILLAGEHPFLTNPESIIRYDSAELVNADDLILKVDTDDRFEHRVDISDDIYNRITTGLMSSGETPQDIIDYCRPYFT